MDRESITMKRTLFSFVGAWCLCAGSALAQVATPAAPAAYESYSYYDVAGAQPSPSDQSAMAQASVIPASACYAAPACDTSCGDACGGGCGICWPCGCLLSDLGEAHKLWEPCCEESQWVGAGWLAQGYVWNPYRPADRFNGPMTWNDRANEYQMNELYYYFGRAAKTDECCLDWGARIDTMYGTNYRWNTSAGFETNFDTNNAFYGLAIPQLYAQLGYNNWDIKVGRWFSPVGYYVVGTANNFFATLPFTFQYGEPFTHTGIIATKKLSDSLTVGGAITHGWDSSDNTGNPHAGGLITTTYTIDDQRTLAYVGVFGPEVNFSGVNLASNGFGYTTRYLQTLVYVNKFSDDVTGVIQSDYGTQDDALIGPSGNNVDARWYGLNTYLYWNQTCRCQWGVNAEWFRDQGGFRVGQVLPSFGSPDARGLGASNGQTRFGYDGSFYRLMFGPKYFFTPNIYGRAALAADWYDGKNNNPNNQSPYDDGTKNHQQAVVFDVIATF
jgi:hypothetical protein